jgi:hypothetical protein
MGFKYSYKFIEVDDFFKKIILNIKEKKINLNMNNNLSLYAY